MTTTDFTTTIMVDQSPKVAFDAINNVRGWWSEEVEGSTENLNDEFLYHYKDVHNCKMKLTEVVPDKKVVWLVLENYFNFTKVKGEWKDTRIVFEIAEQGNKTQICFTHLGLVPTYECFDICSDAWSQYIQQSLFNLITKGKGQPNPIDEIVSEAAAKATTMKEQDYQVSITVNATVQEAFKCVNNVSKWWTEHLEGHSQALNDEFTVRFGDVHVSTQRLVELIPDKKVVWLVTESRLNFIENKSEWTNTKIVFDIEQHGDKTRIHFTHLGLAPKVECYGACTNAWDEYIKGSLFKLLTEGKGTPEKK